MRVLAIAADDSSGHYRIRLPVEVLGDDVQVEVYVKDIPIVRNRRTGQASLIGDCDVFVLQRPMSHVIPDIITDAQARGIAVVVEVDDDFHTVQGGNMAFMQHHPRINPQNNFHHFAECVKRADLVTCSTDALAKRYGSHGRVVVLRNYVSAEWTTIKRRGDGRTLGWAGTTLNHPSDLPSTRGGVARAMNDHPDWRFVCVGGGHRPDDVWRQLELDPSRCEVTEWRPLGLHELVVSQFDVGIAPLHDIVFNHAKSWLKGLEYAALGIPFVAADLPEYRLLEERFAIGVTVPAKGRVWRRHLHHLMSYADEREYLGERYRATVREHLTMEDNAWRWAEAWSEAMSKRSRRTG